MAAGPITILVADCDHGVDADNGLRLVPATDEASRPGRIVELE